MSQPRPWSSSQYTFNPYELSAEPRDANESVQADEAVKRKAGRQKRSSILCQVLGCGVELINEKTYYKRYRICMEHSNMHSMVVDARRQRFCQQCGRFHDLNEFGSQRKSCKRKLKRHNERRRTVPAKGRKWQSSSDSATAITDSEDEAELQAFANVKHGTARTRVTKLETANGSEDASDDTPCTTFAAKKAAQTPFRYATEHGEITEDTDKHVDVDKNTQPSSTALGKDGFAQQRPRQRMNDSTCCASGMHASGSQSVPNICDDPNGNVIGRFEDFMLPTADNAATLPANNVGIEDVYSLLGIGNGADLRHHESDPCDILLFPEDVSDSGVFSATTSGNMILHTKEQQSGSVSPVPMDASADVSAMAAAIAAINDDDDGNNLMNTMTTATTTTNSISDIQSLDFPDFSTELPAEILLGNGQPMSLLHGTHAATAAAAQNMISYGKQPFIGYESDDRLTRISLKVFGCTPDELMPAVKAELGTMIGSNSSFVEGCIRPGCVHVTLNVRIDGHEHRHSTSQMEGEDINVVDVVTDILERNALGTAASEDMMLEIEGKLVVVKQRKIVAVMDTAQSAGALPAIMAVRPLAMVQSQCIKPSIIGHRLAGSDSLILARQAGRNLTLEMLNEQHVDAFDTLSLGVLDAEVGCIEFEAQRGVFVCPARPMLVVADNNVAAEVRQLEVNQSRATDAAAVNIDDFLRDMGFVVQYLNRDNAREAGRNVPRYTSRLLQKIERLACKLVATCIARGWPACARMLFAAVHAAGQSPQQAVSLMNDACPGAGTTLLHIAVGTGCPAVVQELSSWARSCGTPLPLPLLPVDHKNEDGITPLHVAAMLPPKICNEMRCILRDISSAADKLWTLAQSADGTTPDALAEAIYAAHAVPLDMPAVKAVKGTTAANHPNAKDDSAEISVDTHLSPTEICQQSLLVSPAQRTQSAKRKHAKRQLGEYHISALIHEVHHLPLVKENTDIIMNRRNMIGAALMALGMGVAVIGLHVVG